MVRLWMVSLCVIHKRAQKHNTLSYMGLQPMLEGNVMTQVIIWKHLLLPLFLS